MNDLPLVSVLLPSYNHDKYVEEAIMSVVNQSYTNIELIVIDDGSTDNSPRIIEALSKKYNFKFYLQSNVGLVKTLDRLLQYANGKYISIIASDDVYDGNKISLLVDFLEGHKAYDMVYAKIKIIDQHSKIISSVDEDYKSGNIFPNLLCGDFFINGVTALIRADTYKLYKRSDLYIEDFQFWLKIAKSHKIGFVDKYLAFYRVHDNHLSSNLLKMQEAEYQTISKYKNEVTYSEALRQWTLKWLGEAIEQDKVYALRFLPKLLYVKNLYNKVFYKLIVKLIMPRFIWKFIKQSVKPSNGKFLWKK